MNNNNSQSGKEENRSPIFGSWTRIYIWLIVLNLIFVILSYLFMIYYT